MVKARKKIFLLLAGGTWLFDKNQRLFSVQEAEDIEHWLASMPELGIMADLQTIFVNPEEEILSIATWGKIAGIIREHESEADGFILVSRTEQLPLTAAALSFLLPNFSKNIILTASQISGGHWLNNKELVSNLKSKHSGSGLRANLINALQVLASPLPGIAIMFGTRLIPALKVVVENKTDINLFASVDNYYWGRVDFGVNVRSNLTKPNSKVPIFDKLQSQVLIIEDLPGLAWSWSDAVVNKQAAVLIKVERGNVLSSDKVARINAWPVPVVIYHGQEQLARSGIVNIQDCTWPVVVIKTLWAAANAKDNIDFTKMMKKNYLGEYND